MQDRKGKTVKEGELVNVRGRIKKDCGQHAYVEVTCRGGSFVHFMDPHMIESLLPTEPPAGGSPSPVPVPK